MEGPAFQEHIMVTPNRPIFSLAETRKDCLVVVLISTVVKFPLITHIELSLPHLCTTGTILTNFSFLFFLLINSCIHKGPYYQ